MNCVGLKTGNGLSIDATTKLLQYNLNPNYFDINGNNQLSPVLELKGVKLGSGLSIDTTSKLLQYNLNPNYFIQIINELNCFAFIFSCCFFMCFF